MTISTQLRFINLADDGGMSNIVFFQKNYAAIDDHFIAWRVVHRCGYRNYCPITYSKGIDINMIDWNGNHCERKVASPGNIFHIEPHRYGKHLITTRHARNSGEVGVQNRLSQGAVHVNMYRSACLLAQQKNVIPEQWAKFNLQHRLYVAVIPNIRQGETFPTLFLSANVAEFSLQGIVSADIVMSGGGQGKNTVPLDFEMTKVVTQ